MKTFLFLAALFVGAASMLAQTPATAPSVSPAKKEKPGAEQPAAVQLATARKQLAILRSRHGENHPAVERQLRKVAELQKKSTTQAAAPAPTDKAGQLAAAKRELAALRERYTDQHPLVKNQLRKVAELETPAAQQ